MLLDYSSEYDVTDIVPANTASFDAKALLLSSNAKDSRRASLRVDRAKYDYKQFVLYRLKSRRLFSKIKRSQLINAFNYHASNWLAETMWDSSTTAMRRAPSYDELLSLGRQIGPLILARLEDGDVRVQWLVLLRDLYGISPVPEVEKGKPHLMAKRWVDWGRSSGTAK